MSHWVSTSFHKLSWAAKPAPSPMSTRSSPLSAHPGAWPGPVWPAGPRCSSSSPPRWCSTVPTRSTRRCAGVRRGEEGGETGEAWDVGHEPGTPKRPHGQTLVSHRLSLEQCKHAHAPYRIEGLGHTRTSL